MPDRIRPRSQLRAIWRFHKVMWKLSGGRLGRTSGGMKVLELVTTGRKTGEPRSVLLFYRDGATGPVVVGSNAGASKDPAWVSNLRADPNATAVIDSQSRRVKARFLESEERELAFGGFKDSYDDYRIYENTTDRMIAIVALESV